MRAWIALVLLLFGGAAYAAESCDSAACSEWRARMCLGRPASCVARQEQRCARLGAWKACRSKPQRVRECRAGCTAGISAYCTGAKRSCVRGVLQECARFSTEVQACTGVPATVTTTTATTTTTFTRGTTTSTTRPDLTGSVWEFVGAISGADRCSTGPSIRSAIEVLSQPEGKFTVGDLLMTGNVIPGDTINGLIDYTVDRCRWRVRFAVNFSGLGDATGDGSLEIDLLNCGGCQSLYFGPVVRR